MSEDLDALARAIEEATRKVVKQLEEMRKSFEEEMKRVVSEARKATSSGSQSQPRLAPRPLSEQGR